MLAETLGMTVRELLARIDARELREWAVYLELKEKGFPADSGEPQSEEHIKNVLRRLSNAPPVRGQSGGHDQ